MADRQKIRPQPGPQEAFLASQADIVVYGGAAGGGKTYGALLDFVRHVGNPQARGVYFRRTSVQIRNPGGLWDEARHIYGPLEPVFKETTLEINFQSSAHLKFANLEHEKDKHNYQGAQIAVIYFDELTHFTETQFWYMLSRNRSVSGIKPYVRATTNPDATSWVRKLIDWWVDDKTGYAIQARSGVIRYFVRLGGALHWGDSVKEVSETVGCDPQDVKSFTFIPSYVTDNKALLNTNPEYVSNLRALPYIEQERLLKGNWNITNMGGIFDVSKLIRIDRIIEPGRVHFSLDMAEGSGEDNCFHGLIKTHHQRNMDIVTAALPIKDSYADVKAKIIQHAERDKPARILIEKKSLGPALASDLRSTTRLPVKEIDPSYFKRYSKSGKYDKIARAQMAAEQIEFGNVGILNNGQGCSEFISILDAFPNVPYLDTVDAFSQEIVYNKTTPAPSGVRFVAG